jgi:predicted RNA-binding Zn ribbon-like protein
MTFKFLGGHVALDFINTVGGRTHKSANRYSVDRERLENLAEWDSFWSAAAAAAAFKSGGRSRRTPNLDRIITFREALYRVFKAVIEQRRPETKDSELLNCKLAEARAHEKLAFVNGTPSFAWDEGPDPLWIIARAAAELLTSPDLARVRACGGESCGWLFLDTSRNRSRQWCDMADCGNIAKVRRFRMKDQSAR